MTDDDIDCGTCGYWAAFGDGDGTGNCRRYAPRPRNNEQDAAWPITKDSDWCGEWSDPDDSCDCDDDEACETCEPDAVFVDIDAAFEQLVSRIDSDNSPRPRRWWGRRKQ